MTPSTASSLTTTIPPLRQGDCLDSAEFERRYNAMPALKKAELIEGVVSMAAALRYDEHASPHAVLMYWLGAYWAVTPGVSAGDNATFRVDKQNQPQPDALLRILPERGGRSRIDADGYIIGAPELVCEVAASSVSHDRNAKLRIYRRQGILEYLLVRTEDQKIDWYTLRDGQYVLLAQHPDGSIRSETFPGLWLDPRAMFDMDPALASATLQQGLATPEHAAFVARLKQMPPS